MFRRSDQDTLFGNALVELLKAGRFDQAEAGYLKVLGVFRRHLGPRHPLVLFQLGNLAGLYRKQGDMVKAEKTLVEFLELIRPMPAFRSQLGDGRGCLDAIWGLHPATTRPH